MASLVANWLGTGTHASIGVRLDMPGGGAAKGREGGREGGQ